MKIRTDPPAHLPRTQDDGHALSRPRPRLSRSKPVTTPPDYVMTTNYKYIYTYAYI